jgi:hypothetical protein
MIVGKGIEDIDITMPRDAYNAGKYMPTFNAYLTVVVRDSEGRIVKVHRQRSHSPTANFIGLMLPLTYFNNTNSSYVLTNTGNSTYSYKPGISNSIRCITYPNNSTNSPSYIVMIQVGSGSRSNPYSAYSLAAPIANGSGAGQLVYGQPSIPSNVTVSGSSAYFTISQTFNNSSGGTITITEVGIITNLQFTQTGNGGTTNLGSVLVWYDVLSSPISIPNGGSLTIYFTFTVNP